MRIPRISPGSTQLRTTSRQTIRPEGLDTSGKGLQTIGKAVEGIGNELYQKMDEARNYVESSQFALIQAKKNDVKNKYANATTTDADGRVWASTNTPENQKALAADLEAIDKESYKVFSNKDQEAKAKGIATQNNIATQVNVDAAWMKNIARNGQAATSIFYDGVVANFEGSEDQIKAINDRANADIKNNISTPEVAYDNAKKAIRAGWQNLYLTDLNENPALASKRLADNFYKMNVVEKEKAERLYDSEIDRIHSDNGEILDQLEFDNEITEDIINGYVKAGKIDSSEGVARKKALASFESKNPDLKAYNVVVERIREIADIEGWFHGNDTPKQKQDRFRESIKLRNDIFNMRTSGKLSKEEAQTLLEKMGKRYSKFKSYRKGIAEIENFANKNYTPQQRAIIKNTVYKNYMALVDAGGDPIEAIDVAKANLYPKYNFKDLVHTSKETGLTLQKTVELLDNKDKEAK